jgi:hypothetical protein
MHDPAPNQVVGASQPVSSGQKSPLGSRLPLFWCSNSVKMAHQQREIECKGRADEAFC